MKSITQVSIMSRTCRQPVCIPITTIILLLIGSSIAQLETHNLSITLHCSESQGNLLRVPQVPQVTRILMCNEDVHFSSCFRLQSVVLSMGFIAPPNTFLRCTSHELTAHGVTFHHFNGLLNRPTPYWVLLRVTELAGATLIHHLHDRNCYSRQHKIFEVQTIIADFSLI